MGNHIVSLPEQPPPSKPSPFNTRDVSQTKPSSLTQDQTHTYIHPNQPAKMQFLTFILAALMSAFAAAQNATVFDQSFCSGQPQVSGGYTYNSSNRFEVVSALGGFGAFSVAAALL